MSNKMLSPKTTVDAEITRNALGAFRSPLSASKTEIRYCKSAEVNLAEINLHWKEELQLNWTYFNKFCGAIYQSYHERPQKKGAGQERHLDGPSRDDSTQCVIYSRSARTWPT